MPERASTAPAQRVESTARVEEANYGLVLRAPQHVSVGESASATLLIEGRGEYHVNVEYPMRLVLRSSPELALGRSELTATDAAELGAARARFELPFTCRAAGAQRIEVALEFALCTETTCIPQTGVVALELQAGP